MQVLLQFLGGRAEKRILVSTMTMNISGQSHHCSELKDFVMQVLKKCSCVAFNSV